MSRYFEPRRFWVRLTSKTAVVAAIFLLAIPAAAREDIRGVWFDDTGKGAVELRLCGETKQSMCGYIVWLQQPLDRKGRPLVDSLNPEPTRRKQPICGLQVIGRLKPMRSGAWDKGWIYDPKQGKSFDVEIRRQGEDRLKVTGYLGIKLLSESFVWSRAPADIQLCQQTN